MDERIVLRIRTDGNETQVVPTEEEKPVEMESQFVLRLPPIHAERLKTWMQSEKKSGKSFLRIELNQDMRHGTVRLGEMTLEGKVYDLPSIIECHKTLDKKMFFKIADISQIMICGADETEEKNESRVKMDECGRDRRFLHPHGITPSLKNVRKLRFRKTLRKTSEELTVEKEVKRLLKADMEAISSRFEIVSDEEKNFGKNDSVIGMEVLGKNLFGEMTSSSEDSDVEIVTDLSENSTDVKVNCLDVGKDLKF